MGFRKIIFGDAGKIIVVVLAITTTSGLISAALAAVPGMLYGMAHHRQLPVIFMMLHPKWKTPRFGIIFLSALITLPVLIFGKNPTALLMLIISSASCWLLTYIIAHIDLIVLRKNILNINVHLSHLCFHYYRLWELQEWHMLF
ncbi:MAG: APC family permease [Bacteroidetes bacterium]|nr:APC family permease [Bacteroidota bacterium]